MLLVCCILFLFENSGLPYWWCHALVHSFRFLLASSSAQIMSEVLFSTFFSQVHLHRLSEVLGVFFHHWNSVVDEVERGFLQPLQVHLFFHFQEYQRGLASRTRHAVSVDSILMSWILLMMLSCLGLEIARGTAPESMKSFLSQLHSTI